MQYIHTLHAFFLFFLLAFFFLFVVRCWSLLFHDDWTLMQFCIIFALCREQIFQLFVASRTCVCEQRHFKHKFLYVRFPSRPNGLEYFPYTITWLLLKSQHVMRDMALEFGPPSGNGKLIPLLLDAGTSRCTRLPPPTDGIFPHLTHGHTSFTAQV